MSIASDLANELAMLKAKMIDMKKELEAETERLKAELGRLSEIEVKRTSKIVGLECLLAEARAETASLLQNDCTTCAGKNLTEIIEQARQEAAREIVKMLNGAEFEGPNAHKFSQVRNHFVGQIVKTFRLEG